ncbi:MAG: hypothetical protein V3T84_10135 [Phycisphaerales bacterium]
MLQHLGDACAALYPDFLVDPWREQVSKPLLRGCDVVCSDLRTKNERLAAIELGAAIWRVVRAEEGVPTGGGKTESWSRQTEGIHDPTDVIVTNDKDVAHLRQQIRRLIARP